MMSTGSGPEGVGEAAATAGVAGFETRAVEVAMGLMADVRLGEVPAWTLAAGLAPPQAVSAMVRTAPDAQPKAILFMRDLLIAVVPSRSRLAVRAGVPAAPVGGHDQAVARIADDRAPVVPRYAGCRKLTLIFWKN